MLKRKNKNKDRKVSKSQLIIVGSLLIVVGIGIVGGKYLYNYLQNQNEENLIDTFYEEQKEITDETIKKYNNIPWNSIKGMRNRIVHDYENVDLSVLWATIKESLPELKNKLKDIIIKETDILF